MDSPSVLPRPDVVAAPTAPRPTPAPAQAKFSQVLAASARTLVSGADQAVTALPGGPLMAVALRGGASAFTSPAVGVPMTNVTMQAPQVPVAGGSKVTVGPEGPAAPGASTDPGAAAGIAAAAGGGTGVEGALAQSQEMNLYFLQIQEQVNAQDRAYTAYSNVLKAEHDTVMTAVGNIR